VTIALEVIARAPCREQQGFTGVTS